MTTHIAPPAEPAAGDEIQLSGSGRYVSYLRVSTRRQMDTATDIDPDGNSIATQREMVARKISALGGELRKEFIDPGTSAQTIAKRPEFRRLLAFIEEHPGEIDAVVIYMRSRAFRNYVDAGVTERQLSAMGVKLISTKEDFGDGIWADAMKGVADIMNEVQVRMSGEDIRVKLEHKAMSGGTIGRARIGYLNTREEIGGRLVNTIGIDERRAPLVQMAFELYSTGEYSLDALHELMTQQGLTTRPTTRWAERPVSFNKLAQMLRDPYYTGVMVYKGEIVPEGRHQPIISHELFKQVQDVMDGRQQRGTRSVVHHHYLKGILYCQRCHRRGIQSRLIYTQATGHGGKLYAYFKCRGRQRAGCDLPHLPVEHVEEAVERIYTQIGQPSEFVDEVIAGIDQAVERELQMLAQLMANTTKELAVLNDRENRLLDLAEDDAIPRDRLKERLRAIRLERAKIVRTIETGDDRLNLGVRALREGMELVRDPGRLYIAAPDVERRRLNVAFFSGIYLDDETEHGELNQPFHDLAVRLPREMGLTVSATSNAPKATKASGGVCNSRTTSTDRDVPGVRAVNFWSNSVLVGATGIEPVTARV